MNNNIITINRGCAIVVSALCLLLGSCSKEEKLNTECDMLSAWVEGEEYEQYFYRTADMRVENISSTTTEVVFTVRSMSELPAALPVYFTLTDGAIVSPASGSLQDFTAGPVTYTVTSEDKSNHRQYTVLFRQHDTVATPTYTYSFEGVDSTDDGIMGNVYHVFYEQTAGGERNYIWASGNLGVSLVHTEWMPADFPTRSVADGYQGKGVCLSTQDAGALGAMMGKPIAAGNLFIGTFDLEQVVVDPLKSTVFGTPTTQEPVSLSGYYKYQPGETFTNASGETLAGRTDEASVYAVFFRNQNEAGEPVVLYGDDVLTSPYVVKKAVVASLPPTDEWTRFEVSFEGGSADAELLASLGYSMTIVFSSSKNGDTFEGAIGSTLYIDEVTVTYTNE
ncbi:MAG: PCMD domain-containing protein [Bacteroidales bacterium]|nr:PCMD domain-containing protein [Bacteroidales bacterium]